MRGTSSHLRKTTTVFRIGATAYPNGRVVQESAFARFLGSFDLRLYQQIRRKAAIHTKRDIVVDWNDGKRRLQRIREILRRPVLLFLTPSCDILRPRVEPQGRTDQGQLLVAKTVGVDGLG